MKTDTARIKELIDIMIANDLVEIEIVQGDSKVHLKRPGALEHLVPRIQHIPAASLPTAIPPAQGQPAPAAQNVIAQDAGLLEIKSPMVGTFYKAPGPDSPPYVKVGDSVGPDTVVCIVEAMKVMNEIKAELSGTIEKVMVENGQAVEYGQVLFKVRPN